MYVFSEKNPLTQLHAILSRKTKVFEAKHSEDFVIFACIFLMGMQGVTYMGFFSIQI